MENYNLDTFEGLRDTIEDLKDADISEDYEKLALKCIQKAQFIKDIDLEFDARYVYVRQVNFLNKHNLAIAMYPWLLKKCDEDRSRFDYHTVLWIYKWIIDNVREFAKVPLDKIESLLDDFEKRFIDFGSGNKVIHYFRLQCYDTIGEPEKAAKEYKLYMKASTQKTLDDCKACEFNNVIDHLVSHEKFKEALKTAAPIIQGELSCHNVPGTTYPKLIIPSLALGKQDDAENYAILSRKKLRLNQANLREASHLIIYYALKEDFIKGRNVLEKQFPYTLTNASEVNKFYFYLSARIFFEKMLLKKKKSVKMSLPATSVLYDASNTYSIDKTLRFFEEQLVAVSQDLDARNGNNYYSQLIDKKIAQIKSLNTKEKGQQDQ